jgi:hypothetical protein
MNGVQITSGGALKVNGVVVTTFTGRLLPGTAVVCTDATATRVPHLTRFVGIVNRCYCIPRLRDDEMCVLVRQDGKWREHHVSEKLLTVAEPAALVAFRVWLERSGRFAKYHLHELSRACDDSWRFVLSHAIAATSVFVVARVLRDYYERQVECAVVNHGRDSHMARWPSLHRVSLREARDFVDEWAFNSDANIMGKDRPPEGDTLVERVRRRLRDEGWANEHLSAGVPGEYAEKYEIEAALLYSVAEAL